MEESIPDLLVSPKGPATTPFHRKYLHPELSDEPSFNTPQSKHPEKSSNVQDLRQSTELNSSSLQASTQQSINFRKSFFSSSPKRSISSTPLLLANKLKEIQEQSLTMKLGDKLRELEDETERRQTDGGDASRYLKEKNYDKRLEFQAVDIEAELNEDKEFNHEIPHLKWCAFCKAEVVTEVEFINSSKTFWSSVGIFFAGGVFGCFLLPYMTNYCKGVKIICHKCRRPLSMN